MNNDILGLGSAVKEVERLTLKGQKKDFIEIDGMGLFTEKKLEHVRADLPIRETIRLNNLDSLVQLTKNIDKENTVFPLTIIADEQEVRVYSSLNQYKEKETLFIANSQHPSITFNRYISVESQIIQLLTCFKDNDNKSRLIETISKLSNNQSIETNDDGMSQTVSIKKGVTTTGTLTVTPLVKLIPQRTFYEVDQQAQMFLIRIDGNSDVALFDADGGAWKNDAQQTIVSYLRKELSEMVASGDVIIG